MRRLYSLLVQKEHPTIYIDAWESDFTASPLSVVSSELLNQLADQNGFKGDDIDKIKNYLGKLIKGSMIGAAGLLSKYLTGEASSGADFVKTLINEEPKDLVNAIQEEYSEQIQAIKSVRTNLEALAETLVTNHSKNLPVVVLIDELDRCRPDYAIEMLEVIKHFFNTRDFVFVVATDTGQLRESIKAVYGAGFDSARYLRRFFDRQAHLSEPDLQHFVQLHCEDIHYERQGVTLYPTLRNQISNPIVNSVVWISKAYSLSLRDIDQLIHKLRACFRAIDEAYKASSKKQFVNIFSLILAIVEFDNEEPNFLLRGVNESRNDTPHDDFSVVLTNYEPVSYSLIQKLHLDLSVTFISTSTDEFDDVITETLFGNGHPILRKNYGKTETAHPLIRHMFNEASEYYKKDGRFWLWEDYRKLVTLAGNIE